MTWICTDGWREPSTVPSSTRDAMSMSSTKASTTSWSLVRGSREDSSAAAASSGSTNLGPRRGDSTASTTEITDAADSGSSRPETRVMPSPFGEKRRYRRSRIAASRSRTRSRSSSARALRASAASCSRVREGAARRSSVAAARRWSAVTSTVGAPRPARMASAASSERVPAVTAAATSTSQGGAVSGVDGAINSPTRTSVCASRNDEPMRVCTSFSGVRAPRRWASPAWPSSRRERCATSLAIARSDRVDAAGDLADDRLRLGERRVIERRRRGRDELRDGRGEGRQIVEFAGLRHASIVPRFERMY